MSYSILIVDDSDIIRTVLERTIGMCGVDVDNVVAAVNGIDALEKLKDNWFDLIFCDIHMPKMGGLELLENLRASTEFKSIPFIIISTEGSKTRIDELKKKGISGYIRKPFRPENIKDIIVEIFGD